jgi:uncharacterized protein YwqG
MTQDEIREALRTAGLERLANVAERLTLPAIRIEPTMVDEKTIPIGASKLGGRPDLPSGFVWPERDGKPLGFLAQFNLAQVGPFDIEKALPPSGMLYIFFDFTNGHGGLEAGDQGAWQVISAPEGSASVVRAAWPGNLVLRYQLPASIPTVSSMMTLTQEPELADYLDLDNDQRIRFRKMVETLWQKDMKGAAGEEESDLDDDVEDGETDDDLDLEEGEDREDDYEYLATRHQLLGHPLLVHYGAMPYVCEMVLSGQPNPLFGELRLRSSEEDLSDEQATARHRQAYERWRLLLQLGNITGLPFPEGGEEDDDPVWKLSEVYDTWARGGLMYFWIERDRLAQRDFSNVWMLGASQL